MAFASILKQIGDVIARLGSARAGQGDPATPRGIDLASFTFRGNNAVAFHRRSSGELVLYGPAGCMAGEMRLPNPLTGEQPTFRELYLTGESPVVATLAGPRLATPVYRKGVADLIRVRMRSGRSFLATGRHRVLTPAGWVYVADLAAGDTLLGSPADLLPSTSGTCPSVSRPSGPRSTGITPSCPDGCSTCRRPGGEQLRRPSIAAPAFAPSRAGVPGRTRASSRPGGPACGVDDTHTYPQPGRQTTPGCCCLLAGDVRSESREGERSRSRGDGSCRSAGRSPTARRLRRPTGEHHRYAGNTRHPSTPTAGLGFASGAFGPDSACDQFGGPSPQRSAFASTRQGQSAFDPASGVEYPCDFSLSYYTVHPDRVVEIRFERTDEYFDLHVPGEEHYFAEGLWHHNSGKTLANLALVRWFCESHPKARVLMLRKTRVSLTESAMVTWERDVLGPGHPALSHTVERSHRHAYRFPNGSLVVLGGMDKPDKILSTEWDIIYVPECTDLSLTDWEQLTGRLRAGAGPFDLILGDCNPTAPSHWLYKRATAGLLTLLPTSHKDNPRWWDAANAKWTPDGERYISQRLGRLTGPRRKRFLEGVWAAAEGLVYDGYDPGTHLLPHGWQPPAEWRRVWGIDWGYIDPLVIQMWAVDPHGRSHLYREFYKSHTRVETVAKWCRELVESGREPRPSAIFADHDPENVATFRTHSGLSVRPADKANRDEGIQAVQGLFDVRADHRPLIFFRPDAREHEADPHLEDAGRPTSTLEELIGYTWDTSDPDRPKDEPIPHDDHGMDAMRYALRGVGHKAELGTGAGHRERLADHTFT